MAHSGTTRSLGGFMRFIGYLGMIAWMALVGCSNFGGPSPERLDYQAVQTVGKGAPGVDVAVEGPPIEGPTIEGINLGSPLSLALSTTDGRPPVMADSPPVPISGGTLTASRDGLFAVAADPDRDRISIVDLTKGLAGASGAVRELSLPAGSEPGRVVTDSKGRAHVALRRAGTVFTVDIEKATELYERSVCAAPRGMAIDNVNGHLLVACADGVVAELPLDNGDVISRVSVTANLRDIEIDGDSLVVSVFKTSEILRIDRNGNVLSRNRPQTIPSPSFLGPVPPPPIDLAVALDGGTFDGDGSIGSDASMIPDGGSESAVDEFEPQVVWRMHQRSDGSLLMLHELASRRLIPTPDELATDPMSDVSSYGGQANACGGLTQNAVSVMPAGVDASPTPGVLDMPGLVVDIAEFPARDEIAFARPGAADPGLPMDTSQLTDAGLSQDQIDSVTLTAERALHDLSRTLLVGKLSQTSGAFCVRPALVDVDGQVTAVAYTPDGTLLAQSREPAALFLIQGSGAQTQVSLGGNSVLDSGHDLFHRNSGGGIACAQCHPEGGEDGHVWNFSDVGPRRTQPLFVKLEGTAPFHWGGDISSMNRLMDDVFTARMGGATQTAERVDVFSHWLFALSPPTAPLPSDDPAAQRGKLLFESVDVGCIGCHTGANFSDNQSHDVGISGYVEETQTPSLLGVAYRAPYMHIGCANTLRDRFTPDCGGAYHGNTSNLAEQDIDDLIAYLQSL